ncbi:FecR family protein [Pseudotamlana carrageenivorans]|uniref:FecR protein domain-containing protein n=1 Tax=Pseudotamlana carrageenivorans TaxID=2069432 RepID=A0A2I7SJH6_9FLAO|nr:FecR domain-containing protein [Tamlana carrageenivorans]AUS06053.1 hypothetical protein C1A40_11575 [Tamlana carrageenivorans]
MVLADGTQGWLNSDSQIKYPVRFKSGETRLLELVYGEAYFEVSPSTNHNGDSNKVQQINVVGTAFNVKAYQEEAIVTTTLVEGKVHVNYQEE